LTAISRDGTYYNGQQREGGGQIVDDKQREKVIKELNGFLKGRYMGIEQYERLLERAKDPETQDLLREFKKHAELGAEKIARRIAELGGEPVDGPGIMGEMQLWMQRFRDAPEDVRDILHDALVGENKYGIHFSHKMVGGDLDQESKNVVDTVLEEDQKRVDELRRKLQGIPTA
jgi:bacterioferritin